MLHPRFLDILRCRILDIDLGFNTGLMNVGIHILEFFFRNINIHSAQHTDYIGHCTPVKGSIMLDIQIQILV